MFRNITFAALSLVCLPLTGCNSEASTSPKAAAAAASESATKAFTQIKDLLTGATSVDAAKVAKEKLAPLMTQATTAMSSLKSVTGVTPKPEGTGTPGTGLGDMAKGAYEKAAAAISPELAGTLTAITTQIQRITGNAELKAVFGDSLDKLASLIKS